MPFCCERCDASPEKKDFDDGYDQETVASIRLMEMQTNFGLIALMCYQCRREWTYWLNTNQAMKEYGIVNFRLDHWRVAHRKTGKADVEVGLALLAQLNSLEATLYSESKNWIHAGLSRAEKEQRNRFD